MHIICDTSVILMLLQIAPEMFKDTRFECITLRAIYDEIVRTPKFKTKYPWVKDMRSHIQSLPASMADSTLFKRYYETVTTLNYNGVINSKTGKHFDLSREDRTIIACAAANQFSISSGDRELCQFAMQEFRERIPIIISTLELINLWLEKGLIKWDEEKQKYLSLWNTNNEYPQPAKAKTKFQQLTGMKYVGS